MRRNTMNDSVFYATILAIVAFIVGHPIPALWQDVETVVEYRK